MYADGARFRRIILLLLSMCLLSGCTGYGGGKDTLQDGIYYRVSDNGRQAYAYVLYWDLDPSHTDYTVADTVNGARVSALGGYYGTGVPCPLMIRAEDGLDYIDAYPEHYESEMPFHEEEIVFTVRLGPGITEIKGAVGGGYYGVTQEDGSIIFYHPVFYFVCDPENGTFYSEDGRLYYRKDGTPVEDIQSR